MRKLTGIVSAIAITASMMSAPALAAVTLISAVPGPDAANSDTLDAMETQCAAWAAGYETGNEDRWEGEVILGDITLKSGPTESGARDIDLGTVVGIGFHASVTEIVGDPFRNGGSVNMFGQQIATAGYYDSSEYEFDADYDLTYAHAFSCEVTQEVWHDEVVIPHPAQGYYINCDFGHGQGQDNSSSCDNVGQPQGSCAAHNATGPSWPQWGNDTEQCKFIVEQDAYDEIIPEYWDDPVLIATYYGSVDQDQTDYLRAFEDAGSGFEVTGEMDLGKVVVCISPANPSGGKKGVPGEWRQQNGYTGAKCTTAWFNSAEAMNVPNLNLQGTFISVPPM